MRNTIINWKHAICAILEYAFLDTFPNLFSLDIHFITKNVDQKLQRRE